CWNKFQWISNPKCYKCGYPFPADLDLGNQPVCPNCISNTSKLDFVRSVCVYDDMSKSIMLPFKHASILKYKIIMSKAMIFVLKDIPNLKIDIVLPVPLAWKRLFVRGYNQATLLAKPIAKYFSAKLDVDSVKRKYRSDMGHKSFAERKKNISGVFVIKNNKNISGKNILLVDDVMTSGATFNELAHILRKAGAKSVCAVSFCRVVNPL
ncbi:MAG: ComF family protein, partial [Alphaproteobacteria bacterium]|nr:ComF family protein [Alphaproteobacteria bacterium]